VTHTIEPSSIRAFRASVRNEEYVRDVIEQKKKREAEEAAEKERERERVKINPFSVSLNRIRSM
jgi:pre-rRNA-processing protein TSR4